MRRPSRAAAAANPWAPPPVLTVEDDPLAADDTDEVDEHGEPVQELDEETEREDDEPRDECPPGEEALERAELEEEEAEYGPGDQGEDDDEEDDPTSSPLHALNQGPGGSHKRPQAGAGAQKAAAVASSSAAGDGVQLPPSAAHTAATPAAKAPKKRAKTSDLHVPAEAFDDLILFFADIETTSNSKKQYDRVIELAIVAYNARGVELGRYVQRFSNQGVPISPHAYTVHNISVENLRGKPTFESEAKTIAAFLEKHLSGATAGVLCAHNGNSCDFPFLAVEMLRAGVPWPAKLK